MRISLAVFFLAASLSAADTAPDLDTRVANEIVRLDALLKTFGPGSLPKGMEGAVEGNRALLARVQATKSPIVRAYRLRDPYIGTETLRFLSQHMDALDDMKKVITLANERRSAIEKQLAPIHGPALQIALRQNAANRAEKLFRASVPYGKADGASSGLFYLGEAEGNRKYREFVESLQFGGKDEARPIASAIEAGLTKLDGSAFAVYEREPAGRSAASVSARLKEAREQLDRGNLEGASLMMLEAQLEVTRRNATVKTADVPAAAMRDDSIAAMFKAIASQEAGDTNLFITNNVLPFYATLFTNVPAQKKGPRDVKVTLVRWPYT